MERRPRLYSRRVGHAMVPARAVYIGRPSKWGNPHHLPPRFNSKSLDEQRDLRHQVVELYIRTLRRRGMNPLELQGKDLSCWCVDWDGAELPERWSCHGQPLLILANPNIFGVPEWW